MGTQSETDSKKKNDSVDQTSDEPHEGDYKVGCFAPKFVQCFNNPRGFLVVMIAAIISIAMISAGVLNINAVPLERRFGLDSTQSGLIIIGIDIGFFVMTLFISYYGMHVSRPKLVAIGAVVFGLGSFIYSLPHFTSDNYNFGFGHLQVTCSLPGQNATTCFQSENLSGYVSVFLLGSILMGFGVTPFLTLGYAYLEDSVPKNLSPLYLGILNSGVLIGPIVGYLVGAVFLLDYFVDFDKGVQTSITFLDPRWVGAWWVGPLIATSIAWITVVPLAGFPRQLPGTNRIRAARVSEAHNDGGSQLARTTEFGKSIRNFPKAFWIIVRNPVFFCITASGCCQAVVINGVSAFIAKFLENEFLLPTGKAAIVSGAVLVPAAALAQVLSGILLARMKWKTQSILKFNILCLTLVVCLVPIGFVHCNNDDVAGVTVPYSFGVPLSTGAILPVNETLRPGNLTSRCNANCVCQEEFFIPVCGDDGKTYFSPCHAGCFGATFANNSKMPFQYTSCQCVLSAVQKAYPGACRRSCGSLPVYLVIMFFVIFFTFATLTPSLVMIFRVVPEKLRSFAVGVNCLFIRGFGTVPGPLIYGMLIDVTCLLWQTRQCDGSRGSCWIYNNKNMNIVIVCLSMSFNSLAVLLYMVAIGMYKPEYEVSSYSSGRRGEKRQKDELKKENSISENI